MAKNEVRVMAEGALTRVGAGTGSANGWITASAASGVTFAFVRSFSFRSAQTIAEIKERGNPHHFKIAGRDPIEVTYRCAWTGQRVYSASGIASTVPNEHLEFKALAQEEGSASALYYQFYGGVPVNANFQESENEDTIEWTWRFLGMNGPTASGYLA